MLGTTVAPLRTSSPANALAPQEPQEDPGVPGVGETGDRFGDDIGAGDIDGDGYADVAVGVPGEDIGSGTGRVTDAGSVIVLKGARAGLGGTGARGLDQSKPGVPGASESEDWFGHRVLLTDVDGDKKADLTVTAHGEDGTYENSGAAWVFPGTASGATTTGVTSFGPKGLGAAEDYAHFGQDVGR
ncbi:hypothetical protein GCM10010252_50020 [Streptomyces aureoverticillatus]|nr:hypothetical protein GCM10010252_50020 [Streptomyces aureoverticillatus]